jgi:hypothetical protein
MLRRRIFDRAKNPARARAPIQSNSAGLSDCRSAAHRSRAQFAPNSGGTRHVRPTRDPLAPGRKAPPPTARSPAGPIILPRRGSDLHGINRAPPGSGKPRWACDSAIDSLASLAIPATL